MTHRPTPALREALALLRAPQGARSGPQDRLPEGVDLLVRIVGGDAQALAAATRGTGEAASTVRDAAAFYIQQVMFANGSDSYRVLGLDPGATDEQLKSHHRRLTRWLHPDRNRDEWEAVYSERVNRAWQDLRNSERRQRYDQSRTGSVASGPLGLPKKKAAGRAQRLDGAEPGLSLRWLPHAIFGGLGLSAVVLVAVYYLLRFSNQSPELTTAPEGIDLTLQASALANPRVAHGSLEQATANIPKTVAANAAGQRAVEQPEPPPSKTVASVTSPGAGSLPSVTKPSALPSAALRSAFPEVKQASIPAPAPEKQRREPLQQGQVADSTVEAKIEVDNRVMRSDPVPLAKAEVRDEPHSAPFSQREANRIVGRFSEVYADGDLAGMRAMFTADATSPDGGLDSILDEYDRLFGRSKHRFLSVQDVNWSASGKTFTIVASYQATLKTGLLTRTRSQGKLRMEMRQVNDQWRIYRLEHNERTD
jgi:curved DNA-binding protein CbpA